MTVSECVNLSFQGVSDQNEEDPGGFLCVNDDDDDGNGVVDKDDPGPTPGEDDLKTLTISIKANLTGSVTLSMLPGGGLVRLYENADRSNPFPLPHTWTVPTPQLPKMLYVEGVSASTAARDVGLKAAFTGNGGPCEDNVKLTVFSVQPVHVDATDPHAAQVVYHVDPHDITLDTGVFTAPGTSQTATNLPSDFFFTFDQKNLAGGDNTIRLVTTKDGVTCTDDITATRTLTHAPAMGITSEVALITILACSPKVNPGGMRV